MNSSRLSRSRTVAFAAVLLLGFQAAPGLVTGMDAPASTLTADPLAVSADLAITGLTVSPTPSVFVGTDITYTITFVNDGPETATSASVKNTVPANTTFVSRRVVSGTGWIEIVTPPVGGTGDVIWRKNSPGPATGETAQFEVVVKVNPSTAHYTTISDTASTYSIDPNTVDGNSANNSRTATTLAVVIVDPLEPNDTSAAASVLPLGTTSGLIYSEGDVIDDDWYKFFVPPEDAGKELKVNVPPPTGWRSDLDYELLDGSLGVLALAYSGSDNETLYLHNVASGWYYIYVGFSTTDYSDTSGYARHSVTIETGTNFGVGYITGRVVDGGGQGIAQVWVSAQTYPRNWDISFVTVTTGADGAFCVATPPGTFNLLFTGDRFLSPNHPGVNVVDEYYSNKPSLASADVVTVAGDQTVALGDVTMDVGAIASGQVTNMSGTPLANATVRAYDVSGNQSAYTYADASGNYTLDRIPIGGAKLRFSRNGYALEFYDDQPSLGSGSTLATQSGVTIAGVNAQLSAGGTISGSVRSLQGVPIAASVRLYSVLDSTFSRATVTSSATTGAFTFANVKPGDYKIYVSAAGTSVAPEWYNNGVSFAGASVVSVAEGATTSNVNVVLDPALAGDMTGDLMTDILWRHATLGELWLWPMNGAARTAETYLRTVADTDFEIRGVADFDANGTPDLLWRNKANGLVYIWLMSGTTVLSENYVATVDTAYDIVSAADYEGTGGKADILWRHLANGELWFWDMNGATRLSEQYLETVDPAYEVVGSGDLNGDGLCDIVWRHKTNGEVWIWLANNTPVPDRALVAVVPDMGYKVVGVADFTGDGKADILWHHETAGEVWLWPMDGMTRLAETWVATVPDTNYRVAGTGDYNGDRKADILWHHATLGEVWMWTMNGTARVSETWVATVPDVGYQIVRGK
jgi:uncharacterized repeat protein (TIGR01451 family)